MAPFSSRTALKITADNLRSLSRTAGLAIPRIGEDGQRLIRTRLLDPDGPGRHHQPWYLSLHARDRPAWRVLLRVPENPAGYLAVGGAWLANPNNHEP